MIYFVRVPMAEAKQRGWLFYFGAPCPHGHIGKRYIKNKQCLGCSADAQKIKGREQYQKHREKRLARSRKYRAENAERLSGKSASYIRERRKNDMAYAMKARLQARISDAFQAAGLKKNSRTEAMLGCSIQQFKNHIEKQFLPGMTWGNKTQWHIDHILPCASAKSMEELQALFHFTNLRPTWAADNLAKSDRVLFLL